MSFVTKKESKTVYVGMSGGVDSSVAAALLQREGFAVVGVFIKVWEPPGFKCTWREDRRDAMRVAARLDIPLITLDLTEEYKRDVVDYMISEYAAGRTPNPDVMCNRQVKFGAFYDWAMKRGADFVATGHYARTFVRELTLPAHDHNGKFATNETPARQYLGKGIDPAKDQSYFLWTLKPEQLARTLFPVGEYQKSKIRVLAKKFKLPTAEKKDSQGLCFMGKLDVKEFLKNFIAEQPGEVVTEDGRVIGNHEGIFFYTLGERHGFAVHQKTPSDGPYYVVGKNLERNQLIVSQTPAETEHSSLEVGLSQINRIGKWNENQKYQCQIRYHGQLHDCWIDENKIIFDQPLLIAAGQSVVVYDGDQCLGGGVVA